MQPKSYNLKVYHSKSLRTKRVVRVINSLICAAILAVFVRAAFVNRQVFCPEIAGRGLRNWLASQHDGAYRAHRRRKRSIGSARGEAKSIHLLANAGNLRGRF